MGLTNEDIIKIAAAMTTHPLRSGDWALIYLTMIDLRLSSETLKKIKGVQSSEDITDFEVISRLLRNWVYNCGNASLDNLIAALDSNKEAYPGLAKQDYVKNLLQMRPNIESEKAKNDSFFDPMNLLIMTTLIIGLFLLPKKD